MTSILIEAFVILLLIVANGVFSMSELAVVSSRKARLKQWADRGDRKAQSALDLAADPNRFLSTVQIGITLVGTLAGVFGGATIAEKLAVSLEEQFPGLKGYGEVIGLTTVVAIISYFTLVLGELVPKRLAMNNPERIAKTVAGPLGWLSSLAIPIVRLLSFSTNAILVLFGVRPGSEPPVTEEEVNVMVKEGTQAGVFEPVERDMVRRVLRLGDQRARNLMTPRGGVVWLDASERPEVFRRKVTESPHSHFPVCDGTLDNLIGIVSAKDLLARGLAVGPYDLKGMIQVPLLIFEGTRGLKVLEMFKSSGQHVAIILSEYGSVEGILTINDILQAIVGDLPGQSESSEDRRAVQRADGSWLVDGLLSIHEFRDLFDNIALPDGDYETLAGLILAKLGRIPDVSDTLEIAGLKVEVVDMDNRRIDKVLVTPIAAA